jgi:hypothetical protein
MSESDWNDSKGSRGQGPEGAKSNGTEFGACETFAISERSVSLKIRTSAANGDAPS